MKKRRTKTRLLPMAELRPRRCEVDGWPATFLRWIEEDRALLKFGRGLLSESEVVEIIDAFNDRGLVAPNCETDVLHTVLALVEYRDGTVGKINPERIRFTDRRTKDEPTP